MFSSSSSGHCFCWLAASHTSFRKRFVKFKGIQHRSDQMRFSQAGGSLSKAGSKIWVLSSARSMHSQQATEDTSYPCMSLV